jgi:hypothetical protein
MKTFNEFVVGRNIDPLINEVAKLMVETNVNPWSFLEYYYRHDPKIVMGLIESRNSIEEGFLSGVGNAAKAVGQGIWGGTKAVAGAVGKQAVQTGQIARDAMMGPQQRYTTALQAITALSKELEGNKMVQGKLASDPAGYKKLIGDLQGIAKQLQQQQAEVQQKLSVQGTPVTAAGGQVNMGQPTAPTAPAPTAP